MSDIPVEAQQLIVDGIKAQSSRTPRVVLCHSSGSLVSDASCQVCTHDKFEEYFLRKSIKLISVLPSVGSIRRALQKFRGDSFSFEAILACHHSVDIMGLCIDILGRFGTDCNYIQEVHFLVNLPEGTFRKHVTVAYSVLFKSNCDGNVRIRWKKPIEQYDEVMFPKYVLSHDVISNMLKRPGGPLVCHSKKRNGCFDFEGGQNNESLSFKPGCAARDYSIKLAELLRLSQKIVGESPTGAVQSKKRVNWRLLKTMTRLTELFFSVGTLITHSLASLPTTLRREVSTFTFLPKAPLSLMSVVLMLVCLCG